MSRPILPRNNFFDGQQVSESDLDVEQTAWHDSLANSVNFLVGSGVEQEFAVQRTLFDSDDVPASIQSLMTNLNFDGEPIFETDSFGLTVFEQPSDTDEGVQLEVRVTDASLLGAFKLRIYLFGIAFGNKFVYEVLTFDQNESQITRNYFTEIISIMTQDFQGNQNTIVDGTGCRDAGGRVEILEATPMLVTRDVIMAEQVVEPNMDFAGFKPATMSKTLDNLLEEIAEVDDLNVDDLEINTTSTSTRELPQNVSGLIISQKFEATTNNIQKVSILLSVKENTLAVPGHEFDWSGDIVVGIRKLQTTTRCPTDTIPGTSIEFEPEPSTLAEVSFDQDGLEELGIILDDSKQVVDFVFTQSLLANPSVEPAIEVGQYYMITVRRSGNISEGTIVLQEAANTDAEPDVTDKMRMSVFSQNIWTDVPESDLWFRVYSDSVRITNGIAFDSGVQIISPKTKENTATGVDESYIEGKHSFVDVSQTSENYVIVQKANNFTTSIPHPSTGNPVFTRIEDIPDVAVVSETTLTTLIGSGNDTIVLGASRDTNPVDNPPIVGTTDFPGLVRTNTFTLIAPSSDIIVNNLVGSILVPNVNEPDYKYRIVKQEIFDDAYGDIGGDGTIDLNDVARGQALDGYSKTLVDGTMLSVHQERAIVNGTVTMEEIIRADVTGNGYINIYDPQAIQQHIALGTSFDVGSAFKRVVLTVEDLFNPLTVTPNMIGTDSVFNDVPYTPVTYRIDFVPLWFPENLVFTDLRRFVPKTFTSLETTDITSTTKNGGKNISFIPGDILFGGQLLDLDGTQHSVDLEVANVILDLPEGSTQGEIDIFNNFIRGQMKFADGTYVGGSALDDNQVRVSASIASFTKDTDGYDFASVDGYSEIQETVSLLYMQSSGILRIRAANIRNLITRPEMRTKIVLVVHLKKAGFQNVDELVEEARVTELLNPV